MAVARLGLLFAGFLLLTSLVLILLGQAGLQARCKDLNEQALQRYNDMVAREAAAATPSNQTALSANVTAAVTNATTHGFRQVLKIMSQSSSFVTCARLYSLNWWAWVFQIMQAIWMVVAMTGSRWVSNAPAFLLISATLGVINTVVSTNLLGMASFSPMLQTSWESVNLAGFIIATAAQYLFILFGPSHAKSQLGERASKAGPLSSDLQI
ncbi:hypothetical protein F751_6544 [Auxenochlorella protothecoides]|uniref:Uncharacterized protein n=1 Tax=Auxenochlorella protothecoides TaxID=3075 RepID=A0A087STH1_AUXPR|nr:hypothetical protein F751_6544 [Auxenochlorella protothecoides]KFM29025.1 hypothetical protein F751_6544 [Auxenochlorella protothecoides]RMZ54874.1 hypothetical protein APUTEX25_000391 [Auxenochlorella protothecoides]|eukprot:RMZ54874.1 hypothetical protein APUTEX25_000391 [Auxenochlorella protothecoides]